MKYGKRKNKERKGHTKRWEDKVKGNMEGKERERRANTERTENRDSEWRKNERNWKRSGEWKILWKMACVANKSKLLVNNNKLLEFWKQKRKKDFTYAHIHTYALS